MTQKPIYLRPAKITEEEKAQVLECWPGTKGRLVLAGMLDNGNPPTLSYDLYYSMFKFNKNLKAKPLHGKTYRLMRDGYVYQLWEVRYD